MENKIIEFFKDGLILLAFTFSAFWIIMTGTFLIPQMVDKLSDSSITPLLYSLGTLFFSVMIVYAGLKYLKLFDSGES